MSVGPEKPFIERRLAWLEDYKATVAPIESKVLWAAGGLKDYGLLLVRNMFILNAGALIAAPAYASAMKAKAQLLGILQGPISLYTIGLFFGVCSAVSAYYNFSRIADHGMFERSLEGLRLNKLHFPSDDKAIRDSIDEKIAIAESGVARHAIGIQRSYRAAHITGWLSFTSFGIGSLLFMLNLAN